MPKSLVRYYVNYQQATVLLNTYVPQAYPGKVVIVYADKFYRGVPPDWNKIAVEELISHVVTDTTHTGMLRKPSVGVWSKWLNKHLCSIKAGNSDKET